MIRVFLRSLVCALGLFAGACGDGGPMAETDTGMVDAGCIPGTPGCPMMCTPGTAGCACLPGDTCQGSLVCDMGMCRAVAAMGLVVDDPSARSCEAVIVEEGMEVLGVDYAAGVVGTFIREPPRTAIAFLRETDTAFESGTITLRSSGSGTLRLNRVRCFDRDGRPLTGTPLRLP